MENSNSFTEVSYCASGGGKFRVHDDGRVFSFRSVEEGWHVPAEVERKAILMWLENLTRIVERAGKSEEELANG